MNGPEDHGASNPCSSCKLPSLGVKLSLKLYVCGPLPLLSISIESIQVEETRGQW